MTQQFSSSGLSYYQWEKWAYQWSDQIYMKAFTLVTILIARSLQNLIKFLKTISPNVWSMKPVTNDFSHLFTCSSCIKLYWKTKKYNRLSYRPSHSLMVQTKITSNHAIKVKVKKKQSSEFWLVELAYCTRSTILHVHVPVHVHCKSAETWPHTQMFFACMFAHHVLLMGEQRLHNKSRASV